MMNKTILAAIAAVALVFGGCDETPSEYVYMPDSGVGCDPADPCCDDRGNIRRHGEPCGTQVPVTDCSATLTGSVRSAVCNGFDTDCTTTYVVERADVACMEGYDCGSGFLCIWAYPDGTVPGN